MRIAAVGDVHTGRANTREQVAQLHNVGNDADVLLLAGDLTDHGEVEQAVLLAQELSPVKIPVVSVLGNHDFERGRPFAVEDALERSGVRLLDGTSVEVGEVGVAGVKGFGGGFDPRHLGAFGERLMKEFVAEIEQEAEKLESALSSLKTRYKIALLHYAPIAGTLDGEPREIFPFLGSSMLGHVADRCGATMVVHGHAHGGSFEGRTPKGVPVFNCAAAVLRRMDPPRPYALFELDERGVRVADAR